MPTHTFNSKTQAPLDFQEHPRRLEAQGLLVRVTRADQQGHRAAAARALAVSAASRKTTAAPSSSPTSCDGEGGGATTSPVAVGALAASPRIYAVG